MAPSGSQCEGGGTPVPSPFLAGVLGLAEVKQTSEPRPAGRSPVDRGHVLVEPGAGPGPGPRNCWRVTVLGLDAARSACPPSGTSPGRTERRGLLSGGSGPAGKTHSRVGGPEHGEAQTIPNILERSVVPCKAGRVRSHLRLPRGVLGGGTGQALRGFGGWVGEGRRGQVRPQVRVRKRGPLWRRRQGLSAQPPAPRSECWVGVNSWWVVAPEGGAGKRGRFSPAPVPSPVGPLSACLFTSFPLSAPACLRESEGSQREGPGVPPACPALPGPLHDSVLPSGTSSSETLHLRAKVLQWLGPAPLPGLVLGLLQHRAPDSPQ